MREIRGDVQRVESKVENNQEAIARLDSLLAAAVESDGHTRADVSATLREVRSSLSILLENYNALLVKVDELSRQEVRVIHSSPGASDQQAGGATTTPTTNTPVEPPKPDPDAQAKLCEKLYDSAFTLQLRTEYAAAIPFFEQYLETCPEDKDNVNAFKWIAWCHYSLGDHNSTIAAAETMEQKFPENPELAPVLFWTARSKMELDRTADAKTLFQRIVDDYPDTFEAEQAKDQLEQLN